MILGGLMLLYNKKNNKNSKLFGKKFPPFVPAGTAGREQEGKGPRPREPAGSFNFFGPRPPSPRAPSVSGPRPPEPPSFINNVPAPA